MNDKHTIKDIHNTFTQKQILLLEYIINNVMIFGPAIQYFDNCKCRKIRNIYSSLNKEQKTVFDYLIGVAVKECK